MALTRAPVLLSNAVVYDHATMGAMGVSFLHTTRAVLPHVNPGGGVRRVGWPVGGPMRARRCVTEGAFYADTHRFGFGF